MSLSKRDRAALAAAIRQLDRGLGFLRRDDIRVVRTDSMATTSLHFLLADGTPAIEINKEIGSDLGGLDFARAALVRLFDSGLRPPAGRGRGDEQPLG